MYHIGNSLRQLVDCLAHRAAQLAQPLPIQPPVESSTDVGANQPKLDVVRIIDHRVLYGFCQRPPDQYEQPLPEGTHFNHCENNADGAKDGLGRRDARHLLRDGQGFDGHVQRGDDFLSTFRLWGVGIHGFNVDVARENVTDQTAMSGDRCETPRPEENTV